MVCLIFEISNITMTPQTIRYPPPLRLVSQISIHFNFSPSPQKNYQCQVDLRPPIPFYQTPLQLERERNQFELRFNKVNIMDYNFKCIKLRFEMLNTIRVPCYNDALSCTIIYRYYFFVLLWGIY